MDQEFANRQVLAIGHSHLNALKRAYIDHFRSGGLITLSLLQLRHADFQPNIVKDRTQSKINHAIERRIRFLCRRDSPEFVVSCVLGNDYNAVAMINHPRRFDFHLPGRPDLPPDDNADLISFGLVEALARSRLEAMKLYLTMFVRLAAVPVVHIPPPPPLRDAAHIEAYPSMFASRMRELGVSPAPLRLKVWSVFCGVQKQICEEVGVQFHNLPPQIFDGDGYLAKKMWNMDPTHGNSHYGKCILEDVLRTRAPLASEVKSGRDLASVQR